MMGVALEHQAARPARRVNVPVYQDAVIADRYGVRDGVCIGLPSREVLGKEGGNLLVSVAWSRLREAAHGVVVAIGLPELRNPRLNVFQVSAEYLLEPPPHNLDVLLRHRPRSISPKVLLSMQSGTLRGAGSRCGSRVAGARQGRAVSGIP